MATYGTTSGDGEHVGVAQSLVGLAQVELSERSTGRLSALYLPQYLCATLTVTVAVAVALRVIDGVLVEAGGGNASAA